MPSGMDDAYIQIDPPRTEEYFFTAWEVSEFLNSLDLPADKHNQLVSLLKNHAVAVEMSGFRAGLRCGIECMKT